MTPESDRVHQSAETIAGRPLEITLTSSQTSGITAMAKESQTSTVAVRFLTLRAVETLRKVSGTAGRSGASSVGRHQPFTFPPATTRAIALTTKVRTNSTRPAEM